MGDKIGIPLDRRWWCLVGWTVVATLGLLRAELDARVLAALHVPEVFVVVLVTADPGPQGLTLTGCDPGAVTNGILEASLVFRVASVVGCESAASYGEATKVDPRRTVAWAPRIANAILGVFYALSSWLLANAVAARVAVAAITGAVLSGRPAGSAGIGAAAPVEPLADVGLPA